eukprot:2023295-Amphidinium_carterae.1
MATPEQVQDLVTRIQAMEAREVEGLAREQASHVTVQNLTTQLTPGRAPVPVGGTLASGTVDTKALGKPGIFEGNQTKWHDFR